MSFGVRSGLSGRNGDTRNLIYFNVHRKRKFHVTSPGDLAFSTLRNSNGILPRAGGSASKKSRFKFNSTVLSGQGMGREFRGNGELSRDPRIRLVVLRDGAQGWIACRNCAMVRIARFVKRVPARDGESTQSRGIPRESGLSGSATRFSLTRFTLAAVVVDDATATITD